MSYHTWIPLSEHVEWMDLSLRRQGPQMGLCDWRWVRPYCLSWYEDLFSFLIVGVLLQSSFGTQLRPFDPKQIWQCQTCSHRLVHG